MMQSNPNPSLNGIHTYTLTFFGDLDTDFASTFCPPGTMLLRDGKTLKLANLRVDQSGLLGIIRCLHNLGCILLSLSIIPGENL